MKIIVTILIFIRCIFIVFADDTDYSKVNSDGSYAFGYSNSDKGSHYHTASGNPKVVVRGRYGARNPANGKIDETVYTAGPRGYRARGPNIHRKQDLSQVPRGPIGSPEDPLADPYDDPSYGFGFKTNTYQRREEADSNGKVDGQYSYIDDVGEKHDVKYKASASTGYEVENAVPDSPQSVRYNNPLYKAHPSTRGHISFERGPQGTYKFITSGPDQRRAETTGPDGLTRGSYSYLDDKGVQRSVQYIAGAGIGYRVVQSTVGPNTHISANQDVPDYSLKTVNNDITGPDDGTIYHTGPSAPGNSPYPSVSPYVPSSTPSYPSGPAYPSPSPTPYPGPISAPYPPAGPPFSPTPRPFSKPDHVFVTTHDPSSVEHGYPSGPSGFSGPSGPETSSSEEKIFGLLPPKQDTHFTETITPGPSPSPYYRSPTYPTYPHSAPSGPSASGPSGPSGPSAGDVYGIVSTTPTTDHQIYDSTIIKNKGTEWYYGIPPGGTIRAHIQNIDLIPVHERAISPSEALKQDELRESRGKK